MAERVINSSFGLLSKFVACRQESTSKIATSHIRKTLPTLMKKIVLIVLTILLATPLLGQNQRKQTQLTVINILEAKVYKKN